MRIEVGGSPDDNNELQTYTFAFNPATLRITLVDAKRYVRSDEYAPWHQTGHWFYPDIRNQSTISQPLVPDWAVWETKARISGQITLQE